MEYIFGLLLIFVPLKSDKPLEAKNILFIIAHKGFNDTEYRLPRAIFERLGAKVIVGSSDTTIAEGMFDLKVKPDTLLSQIQKVDFDAVIFVGGTGAMGYWDDTLAHSVAMQALKQNKIIGAICVAPIILARAGVLRWKEATVWASDKTKHILKQEKVKYIEKPVVTSDKIVTADGPIAAKEFAEEIVRLLLEEVQPQPRQGGEENESSHPKSKKGNM